MHETQPLQRVVDLTDPRKNIIFNMPVDEARGLVARGDLAAVRRIDGQFALVGVEGQSVRLARSIGRPLRYFIAKRAAGPCLIAADRIDAIHAYLRSEGLAEQFHPSYTRMAPAHYMTTIQLVGCPDPNPTYDRFFTPERNALPADIGEIGRQYIDAVYQEIRKWLTSRATTGPIGVCFSGGIDSGAVLLLVYHALLELGQSPSRLKAFTLSIDGGGADLEQARAFLAGVKDGRGPAHFSMPGEKNVPVPLSADLHMFLEPVEVGAGDIDWRAAVRVVEDYKPLDVQSATMALALCRAIRRRYPDWRWLLDGDGGDENLKDYPIEENPELTIRSVLNNLMLYQEGWGVHSIKHSLTYSGGLSRGYVRTYAPADTLGFDGFSPFTAPSVIRVAEGIPFIQLTDWRHDLLYELKGQIVAAGVRAITGLSMPIFPKRRFQHGAASLARSASLFPISEAAYRQAFQHIYETTSG